MSLADKDTTPHFEVSSYEVIFPKKWIGVRNEHVLRRAEID